MQHRWSRVSRLSSFLVLISLVLGDRSTISCQLMAVVSAELYSTVLRFFLLMGCRSTLLLVGVVMSGSRSARVNGTCNEAHDMRYMRCSDRRTRGGSDLPAEWTHYRLQFTSTTLIGLFPLGSITNEPTEVSYRLPVRALRRCDR